MIRILFLDFDGVLNHPLTWGNRDDTVIDIDKVKRLNDLLTKTGAKIVVSSSWRFGHSINEMQNLLERRGLDPIHQILGITPTEIENRRDAINLWLERMNSCIDNVHFVILDDLGLKSFEGLGKHLIQVSGSIGLTDQDCIQACRCFKRQSNEYKELVKS